ncbi:E3 ubiquitin-protein ligase TRIM71-like [Amphiura filiformis]|uniref:E3 ubiquitin-protein ligase TRIM71-like n=1 Tax=Amphiura filiformis TaxID=82378 RepID=UPI003B220B74
MAASVPTPQRSEDFKEEFLTCSICAESYDNDTHQAKCLPCLHTYCKTCLHKHAGRWPKFNCPKCRCVVTLPGGTVDSLPNNFLVENLKEYHNLFNVAIFCGSCDEENQAVGFCHDCGCFLCQKCMDAHERLGLRLQHKLSSLTELQEKKCNPTTQTHQCKKHSKQELVLFCKEVNCKTPLCAVCGLVEHRGHELLDITAAVDEMIADIKQSSARVSSRNEELAEKRSATEIFQKTLRGNFISKKAAIQKSEQQLIKLIKNRSKKVQNQLSSEYQTQMDNLSSNLESIDILSAQMTSACEFANKACETSHPMQLLTAQIQVTTKLHELVNTELPAITSETTEFTFTDKHQSATARIQDSIKHLYDVAPGDVALSNPPTCRTLPPVESRSSTIHIGQQGKTWYFPKATVTVYRLTDSNKDELMTTGGSNVVASQGGKLLLVQDNNDGTYTFEYWSLGAPIHVNINGTPMKGSPFKVR